MNPLPNDEQPSETPRTDAVAASLTEWRKLPEGSTLMLVDKGFACALEAELAIANLAVKMTTPWEKAMLADARLLREKLAAAEKRLLEAEEDKKRMEWCEEFWMSLSRLTAPDMSGIRFMGQCHNPAKSRGEAGPSFLRIKGQTFRETIDSGRLPVRPTTG